MGSRRGFQLRLRHQGHHSIEIRAKRTLERKRQHTTQGLGSERNQRNESPTRRRAQPFGTRRMEGRGKYTKVSWATGNGRDGDDPAWTWWKLTPLYDLLEHK